MSTATLTSPMPPPGGTASGRLAALAAEFRRPDAPAKITVGEVVDRLGEAGLGLMLLVLSLPGLLPSPGLPVGLLFGLVISAIGAQIIGGATRLWLPERLRARALDRARVAGFAERSVPWLRRAERLLRPGRLGALAGRRMHMALALPILAMGIVLALPIPFGNVPPAAALVAFALGLLERDGLAVLIGLVLGVLAILWMVALTIWGARLTGAALDAVGLGGGAMLP